MYDEPTSYEEAMTTPERVQWDQATDEELKSLVENRTWIAEELPPERKALDTKLIYKVKTRADGTIERYKTRLVVRGFQQKFGMDYDETYAPVVKFTTVRLALALACKEDMHVHQMDVKTAFLNGKLNEVIYVRLPTKIKDKYGPGRVVRLLKSLYGLKQAPRVWFEKLRDDLMKIGFIASRVAECFFMIKSANQTLLLLIYVDDLILMSKSLEMVKNVKYRLSNLYKMVDKGEARYFLGVELRKTDKSLMLSQEGYIHQVLQRFGMNNLSIGLNTSCAAK